MQIEKWIGGIASERPSVACWVNQAEMWVCEGAPRHPDISCYLSMGQSTQVEECDLMKMRMWWEVFTEKEKPHVLKGEWASTRTHPYIHTLLFKEKKKKERTYLHLHSPLILIASLLRADNSEMIYFINRTCWVCECCAELLLAANSERKSQRVIRRWTILKTSIHPSHEYVNMFGWALAFMRYLICETKWSLLI